MTTPPPLPTDPPGTFVGDVHVVVEGKPVHGAVALVHGIPGSVRDFRYLGPALAACGLQAVRMDLPGFGETPAHAFAKPGGGAATTLPGRAAFVRHVMKALGHARFAVAGHSFGGGIATLCASLFPDDVSALVAINSIGPRRHRGYGLPSSVYRASARAFALPVVGSVLRQVAVQGYAARGLRSDVPLTAETLALHAQIIGGVRFRELRAAARTVRCPALVVSAKDDPLMEPACGFALAAALSTSSPLCSHLHVARGGHFLQKHEAVAIARWLAKHVAARVGNDAPGSGALPLTEVRERMLPGNA